MVASCVWYTSPHLPLPGRHLEPLNRVHTGDAVARAGHSVYAATQGGGRESGAVHLHWWARRPRVCARVVPVHRGQVVATIKPANNVDDVIDDNGSMP